MGAVKGTLAIAVLAVMALVPITALSYTSHIFNSVKFDSDLREVTSGGHSPQGNILAVGGLFYLPDISGYAGSVVVSDISAEPFTYKELKLLKSKTCTDPNSIVVTALTAEDSGNLYVGGYAQYISDGITRYFVARLEGSPGSGYSLGSIKYYEVGEIMDIELANHPYFSKVLLVAAVGPDYPVILILDPTDLSIEYHLAVNSNEVWGQSGVEEIAVSMDSAGNIVVAATLSYTTGAIALFTWSPSDNTYNSVYVVKNLNGLQVHDVLVNEEEYAPHAYIAAAKKWGKYTDWGTGTDFDPVLIKVNLRELVDLGYAFEWVLIIDDDSYDDYAYAVALYDGGSGSGNDRIILYGSLAHSGYSGKQYPLIGVVRASGEVDNLTMVPAPSSSDFDRPQGAYYTGSVYEGYVFAMGTTNYTTDSYDNVGLLLYSSQIADWLNWKEEELGWPSVSVLKDISGIATVTTRTDINPSISGPYSLLATLPPSSGTLTCVELGTGDPVVYTAKDEITPVPVPEPWYAAIIIAVIALALAVFYRRG
ncbi:MAG: hypothetical protein GSR73_07060 [Desulfurococcales archaeon]|nr:hypothetical protein [Desulfurococcales archaeon]